MGRVSRIMKAVTEKASETRPTGPEGTVPAADADLSRLIACWMHMPPHFKQTIMTLVEVVESKHPARSSSESQE